MNPYYVRGTMRIETIQRQGWVEVSSGGPINLPHMPLISSQHTIPTAMSNASNYSLPQAESSMDPYSLIHLQQVLRMIGLIWGEYNQLLTDIIYTNNSP